MPGRKTVEDYLALETDQRVELINGEFVVSAAPFDRHQDAVGRLFALLLFQVDRLGIGRVFVSPWDAHLPTGDVVEPDVIFVARENIGRIRGWLYGPPDIAVEVLSEGNERQDRIVKRDVYERAGIPEYWIVDPQAETVQVLRLTERRYAEAGVVGVNGTLTSPLLPGVSLPLRQVFRSPTS